MFRASPWISYEPSNTARSQIQLGPETLDDDNIMDGDIDMDAPQISTLRDEETPPPTRTSKFRVKLLINDSKGAASSSSRKQGEDEDEDEDEDEEDQLIDDDDDDNSINPNPLTSSARPLDVPGKRRPSHKRKPRKSEKRIVEDERQARAKEDVRPEIYLNRESPPRELDLVHNVTPEPLPAKIPSKKKVTPKKTPAAPRSRAKGAPKTSKDVFLPLGVDDPGVLSETYTGTAASSPLPFHYDAISPEPDNIPHPMSAPFLEETNLDSVALPIYPLPSKPFPVQPPPKVSTGFASAITLDKSGAKVRHWRVANREIRGIAGGRWFAHAWVGDKDSEFATSFATSAHTTGDGDKASASSTSGAVVLPKLSSVPISAPSGKGARAKLSKARAAASTSAATSRAGSAMPDPHVARALAPTKMRTIIAAPPSEADSDITTAA